MERTLYDLLETLIAAKYTKERTALLQAANLKLEILWATAELPCVAWWGVQQSTPERPLGQP